MSNISKAPWKVAATSGYKNQTFESMLVNDANGNLVADCNIVGAKSRTDKENIANAKLIAGAPELMECLKSLNKAIDDYWNSAIKTDFMVKNINHKQQSAYSLIDRLEQH